MIASLAVHVYYFRAFEGAKRRLRYLVTDQDPECTKKRERPHRLTEYGQIRYATTLLGLASNILRAGLALDRYLCGNLKPVNKRLLLPNKKNSYSNFCTSLLLSRYTSNHSRSAIEPLRHSSWGKGWGKFFSHKE